MGVIEDVRKALADVPLWKRLGVIPDEVDDLKRRVAELEAKLGGKWPPDVCRFCGERACRLSDSGYAQNGVVEETWTCSACGQHDDRRYRVATR